MRALASVLLVIGSTVQIFADQPSSIGKENAPISVIFVLGDAWLIEFKPDGSGHAQYGSLPNDEADLPPGTVDFNELANCTLSLRASAGQKGRSQAYVFDGTDASRTAFYLRDDTLYVYLLNSFAAKWTPRCPADRFEKLTDVCPLSLQLLDNG